MAFGIPALDRYFSHGDEGAFASVVTAYLPLVFSAAVRITRDRPLSEEIAQTVFSRLAGMKQGLPPGLPLATWLHRTTRTVALNAIRAERRRQQREEIAAGIAMNETPFPWERISPVLDEVLEKLAPQDREVVLSRFFLGESNEELGRRLGLNHEAVKKRLQRALGRLRDDLSRRGIRTTTAALALSLPAYGIEATGTAMSAAIASAAMSSPLAPSAFTLFATFLMKQSLAVSAVAILTAGSFWLASQARSAAALEGKISNLKHRISLAEAGGSAEARSPRSAARLGSSTGRPIDWQSFMDIWSKSPDDTALRILMEEMNQRLAGMVAEDLSHELDRLVEMNFKEEDYLEIQSMILKHLTEKDPALALHHLESQLADDRQTPETFMAFQKWLPRDPQAAIRWLDAQAEAGRFTMKTLEEENPTRKWLEGSLLPHLLVHDPAAVMPRLMKLPEDQRRGVFAVADIPEGQEAAAAQAILTAVPVAERSEILRTLVDQVEGNASDRDISALLLTPGVVEQAPGGVDLIERIKDPKRREEVRQAINDRFNSREGGR